MKKSQTYPSQLLKGTFQTIILKLLADHPNMYGYEISQKVKERSEGTILLPEASLYPILHKMTEEGLLTTEKKMIGKRVRRYYSITPSGRTASEEKLDEFKRFFKTMNQVLAAKPLTA